MGFECPICFDAEADGVTKIWCVLPCRHTTCLGCLLKLDQSTNAACPMCRRDVSQLVPERIVCATPRVVSLNVQSDIDEHVFEEIVRRVQVSTRIHDAVIGGAAPRNRSQPLVLYEHAPATESAEHDDED